jgi:tripartite-type tricarboxylate transporter receptor subunit TctC
VIRMLLVIAALACTPLCAHAQGFPTKPIRVFVTIPPGGSPDVLARAVGLKMSESIGQQVVVESRTGAGGIVAVGALIAAPPDGYTLLMADSAVYAVLPYISRSIPYDMLKDMTPVALAATSPIFLTVSPSLGVNSVQEFIALARAKPGQLYASAGEGTAHHLAMEMLKSLTGLQLNHVPYKGAAQALPAVISGDVAAAFAGMNLALPQHKAGKVKMLAVATPKRSALVPELPSIAEAGVPGFAMTISLGFLAPLKTPRDVVERLNGEITKAANAQDVQQRLFSLGVEASPPSSPEHFAEIMRSENQAYGKLVKAAGIRTD